VLRVAVQIVLVKSTWHRALGCHNNSPLQALHHDGCRAKSQHVAWSKGP
jgi:hypothetical protein